MQVPGQSATLFTEKIPIKKNEIKQLVTHNLLPNHTSTQIIIDNYRFVNSYLLDSRVPVSMSVRLIVGVGFVATSSGVERTILSLINRIIKNSFINRNMIHSK